MSLEIDPVSAESPDMDEADFAALKQSIAQIGQLVAIVTIGDRIIDGRKRYRACQELGKTPAIIALPIGADPASHAIALNLLRTHYSPSQRGMYASVVATKKREDNLRHAPRNPNSDFDVSTQEAAAAAGVSRSMVADAKSVRRRAIPEVVSAVERGDLTIHTAMQIADVSPKSDQAAALTAALGQPKGRNGRRVGVARVAPELRRRTQPPRAQQFERTLGALEVHAETLMTLRFAVPGEPDKPTWIKRLRSLRTELTRVITCLERQIDERPH